MLTRFLCLHIRLCLIHHHNNECSVVVGPRRKNTTNIRLGLSCVAIGQTAP
jgi:hypothetical protein